MLLWSAKNMCIHVAKKLLDASKKRVETSKCPFLIQRIFSFTCNIIIMIHRYVCFMQMNTHAKALYSNSLSRLSVYIMASVLSAICVFVSCCVCS